MHTIINNSTESMTPYKNEEQTSNQSWGGHHATHILLNTINLYLNRRESHRGKKMMRDGRDKQRKGER